MNNHCDAEWFGYEHVFNYEEERSWKVNNDVIVFPKGKSWKDYVLSKRLEITCGEAPYIVSRYDAATGDIIDINMRIGILDRKLRVITENVPTEKEWVKWAFKAYESVYGYEFQGDNLLIARVNLVLTFVDYLNFVWHREPTKAELSKLVKIIVWNFWQMDGITGTVPFGKPQEEFHQMTFWDFEQGINDTEPEQMDCKIYDWVNKEEVTYRSTISSITSMASIFNGCVSSLRALNICLNENVSFGLCWKRFCSSSLTCFFPNRLPPLFFPIDLYFSSLPQRYNKFLK